MSACLAAGACPGKILLGVPFYGYGWSVAPNAPNPDGQFDPATPLTVSTENHNYIKTTLESVMQAFQDHASNGGITKTPWLFDRTNFWTYDDADSIYQKMEYVRSKGLGGAFAWELSGDLPDGHLEKTIYAGLSGLPLY